jgi:hypothetical protein
VGLVVLFLLWVFYFFLGGGGGGGGGDFAITNFYFHSSSCTEMLLYSGSHNLDAIFTLFSNSIGCIRTLRSGVIISWV